jgi:DNA-directed RNA polymerase sigma subunit (sigma70/sigma32)
MAISRQRKVVLNNKSLTGITARERAMLKLRYGSLPLKDEELAQVVPECRCEAAVVRPRTLEDVSKMFGLTRERVRQINNRSLRKLGITKEA